MCGRFQLAADASLLAKYFSAEAMLDVQPRFNIAPRQDVPVVRSFDNRRQIVPMNWGLLPSWAKESAGAPRPINAKSETVATNGLFRSAFAKRRCLIPATGFYEWQIVTPKQKQPYLISLRGRDLFAMAGLYENFYVEDKVSLQTFTIITTAPNNLVSNVHDRMPVILSREDESLWLDQAASSSDLQSLLTAYAEGDMQAIKISSKINNVANEGPDTIILEAI